MTLSPGYNEHHTFMFAHSVHLSKYRLRIIIWIEWKQIDNTVKSRLIKWKVVAVRLHQLEVLLLFQVVVWMLLERKVVLLFQFVYFLKTLIEHVRGPVYADEAGYRIGLIKLQWCTRTDTAFKNVSCGVRLHNSPVFANFIGIFSPHHIAIILFGWFVMQVMKI